MSPPRPSRHRTLTYRRLRGGRRTMRALGEAIDNGSMAQPRGRSAPPVHPVMKKR